MSPLPAGCRSTMLPMPIMCLPKRSTRRSDWSPFHRIAERWQRLRRNEDCRWTPCACAWSMPSTRAGAGPPRKAQRRQSDERRPLRARRRPWASSALRHPPRQLPWHTFSHILASPGSRLLCPPGRNASPALFGSELGRRTGGQSAGLSAWQARGEPLGSALGAAAPRGSCHGASGAARLALERPRDLFQPLAIGSTWTLDEPCDRHRSLSLAALPPLGFPGTDDLDRPLFNARLLFQRE